MGKNSYFIRTPETYSQLVEVKGYDRFDDASLLKNLKVMMYIICLKILLNLLINTFIFIFITFFISGLIAKRSIFNSPF